MNFGENGFAEFIIQKEKISNEEINSIFWLHVSVAILLALGFAFFGLFLVDFYSEPALSGIAVAMSSSIVFMAFSTCLLAILKREMKFATIAVLQLIAVILSIVFAVAAATAGMGYWAVVIRQLTVPFVTVIGSWILCKWRPCYPAHISKAIPALKYATMVYCNFSLSYLSKNLDKILLGRYHGSQILGDYDRAYHLSSMPINQLLSPLNNIALSTLSRLISDRERFVAYYIKAVAMLAFIGTFAALLLTLTAEYLIQILLGPQWKNAGSVVKAFGPGIAATIIYGTFSWLHLSLGTPNRWFRWNVVSSTVTIIGLFITARYGPVAVAITYSLISYILALPAIWYAGRPVNLRIKVIIHSLWAYFASAFTVYFSWTLLSAYWSPLIEFLNKLSVYSKMLMLSSITLFSYLALIILFQQSLHSIREILSLMKIFLTIRRNQF